MPDNKTGNANKDWASSKFFKGFNSSKRVRNSNGQDEPLKLRFNFSKLLNFPLELHLNVFGLNCVSVTLTSIKEVVWSTSTTWSLIKEGDKEPALGCVSIFDKIS